jgi:hypothetical protein
MTLKTINKQKSQEVELLEEEVKNTRKCQKESKKQICTKMRSIVATMTPIVPLLELLSAQGTEAYHLFF